MEARGHDGDVRGLPYLLTVLGVAAGLVLATLRHPVAGTTVIGLTFVTAGIVRLTTPSRATGLLAVRSRALDAAVLVGLGGTIMTLTLSLRGTYSG